MAEMKAKIILDTIQPMGAIASLKKALQDIKSMIIKPTIDVPKVDTAQAKEEGIRIGASIGEGVQSGLSRIGQTALGMYVANLFTQLSSQVLNFGRSIIQASADVEQLGVAFEVLLGSSTKAQSMLAAIREYAEKTPYETEQLSKVVQTMLSFGIPAEQVMDNLRALGDVAMGNGERLQSLGMAFSQVQSTGRLMGQDLLQMINAGFNPLLIISQKTGLSIGELKKKMEDGAISAEMVRNAFIAATSEGGQFFGMTEKQSRTFAGVMSTLKDNVKTFGIALAKDVFERLKDFINSAVVFIGKLKTAFDQAGLYGVFTTIFPPSVGAMIYGFLKNIVDGVVWLGKTLWAMKPILLFIGATVGTWMMIEKTVLMVKSAIIGLQMAWRVLNLVIASNPFVAVASVIIGLAVLIYTYWEDIKAFFVNLWSDVAGIFEAAWEGIKEGLRFTFQAIFDIITLFNPLGFLIRTIQGDWGVFQGLLDALKNMFKSVFSGVYETAKDNISKTIEWFGRWWTSVEQGSSIFAGLFRKVHAFADETAKGVKFIWDKLIEWVGKAWSVVANIVNKVSEFLFGKKKEVPIKVDSSEITKATQQQKEYTQEAEKSEQKAQETTKAWQFTAKEQKKASQQRTKDAEQYLKEKEREKELARQTLELAGLEEARDKLNLQKQQVDSLLQELQSERDVAKTYDTQKSLLLERLRIEMELLEVNYERQKVEATTRLEERLAKENEEYEKARASAKGNKDLLKKVDEAYVVAVQNIYAEHSQKLLDIERARDGEILKLQTETSNRLRQLNQKLQDENRKAVEKGTRDVIKEIQQLQDAFADIYKAPAKKSTEDIDRQIEELDDAYAKGSLIEQEYTERRAELTKQRKSLADEESRAIREAFGRAFETGLASAMQMDSQMKQITQGIQDLLTNLSSMSSSFAEQFSQSQDASQSFSDYFSNLGDELAKKWNVITQYIAIQTGAMASQMMARGVPALEAFKKSFLLTMLDMVEKMVITQLPAISALISGTIPFPANLPIIAMITAMIMTALEVAKAKIRGAERGYLSGFREGTRGASDTMLIYINPREAILPASVVERNREALKMMLQGISFDRQLSHQQLANRLASVSDRASSLQHGLPKITPVVRVKISNEIDFKPIKLRPNELLITAERYRSKMERLAR